MREVKLNGLEWDVLCLLRGILGDKIEIIAQDSYLPGTPDFVIGDLMLIIECDGDFYHDKNGSMSRAGLHMLAKGNPRGAFWLQKAGENAQRDKNTNRELKKKGYKIIRLKENRVRSSGGLAYVSKAIAMSMRGH